METKDNVLNLYKLFVRRGRRRSQFIETVLEYSKAAELTIDDERNEPSDYMAAFSESGDFFIMQLFEKTIENLKHTAYENSGDLFAALVFIKATTMKAIHSYGLALNTPLAPFASEFDRLDVEDVRVALYERVNPKRSI
jgi:hypothetical protein